MRYANRRLLTLLYFTNQATLAASITVSRKQLSGVCPCVSLEGLKWKIKGWSSMILRYVCHITPILHSLHWLKITERIEYKILSLTYKVLTTAQPSYLHHLITVQPHRSTRSSSVVTLSRPLSSSSLRITDRSFRYASPRLWNQLPASLWQPRAGLSISDCDLPTYASSAFSINSPLSTSINPSLFHTELKT